MNWLRRRLSILFLAGLGLSAGFGQAPGIRPVSRQATSEDFVSTLPTGDRWLAHLTKDLLPFWTKPAALGNPLGAFPSTRCDDGSLLDFNSPCLPIAGNSYLMTPARYLVPLSRQTYGYGVAYHLTGDPKYLGYMKVGIDYIRQNAVDPSGGMFTQMDLTTGAWGPAREFRDPQQLGYGLLGLAFYYYLTRDDAVLPDIFAIKDYIFANYYNPSLGTMQWLLRSDGGTRFDEKHLVSDLDQMNTYLVLLTPILPEPYQSKWKQTLILDSHSILSTFYSPADNLFFLQADTPQDKDLASTGVDVGHSSKALWMIRWTGLITGDRGLVAFAEANGRKLLDRAYLPEDGSWAQGVLQGGALDKNKGWWIYAELDQLSGTLALSDLSAGSYLPQTTAYWFQYFVDHRYGEVWNGVNYGANTPQRDFPKAWQWKSAYHSFEHALVGYITSQQLHSQPFTLHYAFRKDVDQGTIHPYYFSGTVDSVTVTQDIAGHKYQAVTFHGGPTAAAPPVTITSAASFLAGPLAVESIVCAQGSHLATGSAQAGPVPATRLAGTTVLVTDSTGTSRPALLFDASPTQVTFEIPEGTATGAATLTFTAGDGTSTSTTAQIAGVFPGIFQLNTLTALAAASVVRVKAGQAQTVEPVYQFDASNNVLARPIDLGAAGDAVYLTLFGTGIRNAKGVTVTVGGQNVPVLDSGAQGTFAGVDQVNAGPLPRSLAGAGKVNIVLMADGQTASPVELEIK